MESKEKIKAVFGRNLQRLRLEKDLSIRSLAARSGMEYSHMQRIVSGKVSITLHTIYAVAKGLNVPAAALLPELE